MLVPGLTDKFDEIEGLAAFARELGNVERVDVLPFHKMGEFKWAEVGVPYQLAETEPPSPELLERVRAVFRKPWPCCDVTTKRQTADCSRMSKGPSPLSDVRRALVMQV